MSDHKKSTADALNRFYQKQADEVAHKPSEKASKRAPNKAPEKDVERECLAWMRARGWTVAIFESKAKWNASAERFTSTGMKFGTCDCMGNTDDGISVAVEFKAPGALSSFNSEKRYLQRKFIVDRINTNAFACVVDSAKRLETIYQTWRTLRATELGKAREFLLASLPQMAAKTRLKDEKLFDDE